MTHLPDVVVVAGADRLKYHDISLPEPVGTSRALSGYAGRGVRWGTFNQDVGTGSGAPGERSNSGDGILGKPSEEEGP
ncbi:hypothetical protein GCM10017673_32640 [Streptosporangium violaceochromogenes]|nr:hypothetical protein GCM10017673_32640 [Streptosporangium violaceochromogenes]